MVMRVPVVIPVMDLMKVRIFQALRPVDLSVDSDPMR